MFPIPLSSLTDQERHDYILKTYVLSKTQNAESRKHKRDIDVIKENHRFLWEDEEVIDSWEKQLARRYYDKLFKEYCISDLSRYKENKVALRWRVETEVISGKGQFQCGNRKCEEKEDLKTWEVNFAYLEEGQRKNALVKLRLCPDHSSKLNYTSQKREVKRLKHNEKLRKKESKKHSRRSEKDINSSDDSEEADIEDDNLKQNACVATVSTRDEKSQSLKRGGEVMDNLRTKKSQSTKNRIREKDFKRYIDDLLL